MGGNEVGGTAETERGSTPEGKPKPINAAEGMKEKKGKGGKGPAKKRKLMRDETT